MWEELGISGGTALIVLAALYFIIKWAVCSAISESSNKISKAVQKGMEKYYEETESNKPEQGSGQ